MHSPPVEWSLFALHFGVVDYLRDRGEPDGDTASEVIRQAFRVHTRSGNATFTAALIGAAFVFHRHITKP